ncbi:MAG: hypothetical protein ACREC4_08345, partial [Methylocella sp.]
ARRTFRPSGLTPRAISSEIEVDFLASLTPATGPSRINRMREHVLKKVARLFRQGHAPTH